MPLNLSRSQRPMPGTRALGPLRTVCICHIVQVLQFAGTTAVAHMSQPEPAIGSTDLLIRQANASAGAGIESGDRL